MAVDSPSRGLPDAAARRRAATDFATNLVVLAGAGTGKTSLLVERALVAIGSGLVRMQHIAAITFTEKAAGEMRERLALGLDRLRALADDEVPLDMGREADRALRYLTEEAGVEPGLAGRRAREAMEELDGGTVVTIHRFCSELLRGFPLEAGVDPAFTVDNGQREASLGREVWESFVARELGPDAERAALWRRVLAWVPLGKVGVVARRMAGFDIPGRMLEPSMAAPVARELFAPQARRTAEAIASLLARQRGMTDRTVMFFVSAREVLEALDLEGLGAFQRSLNSRPGLVQLLDGKHAPTPNTKLAGVTPDEMKSVAKQAFRFCRRLRKIDEARIRDLVEVVAPFARELREHLLRRGVVSFDGLLALTRDLLRDHPEVRRELKRRYRLLLVDEFQDTDPLQYEIVLFLAEHEADEAGDAYRARLAPGRLFVVGDPKQSIYRFRGADFAACRRAIDRIVEAGGQRLDLTGNFRGVTEVIRPVNLLFEGGRGCWIASPYQPDYVPIQPVRGAGDGSPGVELWTVDLPPGAKAEERRAAEGLVIAEQIEQWVASGRCKYEQITILFRAFTNITYYLRSLREYGIPFVVDGGRDFLKRPEVEQLMATLRTLSQPLDQPALLALLRSPAGGVSDVELAAYARGGGTWSWHRTVDAASFPRIACCFELLQSVSRETRHLPADAVVRRVVERMHLLPLGAAAFEGAQRVANLQKLAAAAGELARDGKLSLEEVVEALAEGRLEDIETDRPLADDAAEAVRITSIHRMKGLENDWILLPDLARQPRGSDVESEQVRAPAFPDGRPGLVIRANGVPNAGCVWYEMEDAEHDDAEEVRVLYVAMTRAREHLVVLAGPSRNKAPWVESLSPWGYDVTRLPADGEAIAGGDVVHRLLEPPPLRRAPAPPPFEVTARAVREYTLAAESLRGASRPPFDTPSGLAEEEEAARDASGQVLLFPAVDHGSRDLRKAVGIVIHRLLETWDGHESKALLERLAAASAETARETATEAREVERESAAILAGFLKSDLALRFARVEKLGREVSMLLRREAGDAYRGSIDLLYRDADCELVVADFKTDRDAEAPDLERRYGGQLRVYAEAVARALDSARKPRLEIWLLRSGRRVILGPPA